MANIPVYATGLERSWYYGLRVIAALVLLFLMAPLLVVIPLSLNAVPYFTFTKGMLSLDPEAYSLRWYREVIQDERWLLAIKNSFSIAFSATLLSTFLGTLAAIGLSRAHMPYRTTIMSILISPIVVPLVIMATGMYFFYAKVGLNSTYLGVVLAHTARGTPFVVITVTATLVGFDNSLVRASASLGATPIRTFFKVVVPLVLPGVVSGAGFAFVTSFDDVVVVMFLAGYKQRTIPLQMWSGIREEINPTILAVATLIIILSMILMFTLELLRRRNERLRGIRPA